MFRFALLDLQIDYYTTYFVRVLAEICSWTCFELLQWCLIAFLHNYADYIKTQLICYQVLPVGKRTRQCGLGGNWNWEIDLWRSNRFRYWTVSRALVRFASKVDFIYLQLGLGKHSTLKWFVLNRVSCINNVI